MNKVVIVSKSDSGGGAAAACLRLFNALRKINIKPVLLVQERKNQTEGIYATSDNWIKNKITFFRFAFERYYFSMYERSKEIRFAFSPANIGENIHKNKRIKEADIIHLHWFNFGFLSLKSLEKLLKTEKPVVWTLHDMWAFTGGCHYAGECINYQTSCKNCNYLKNPSETDLANKIFKIKESVYRNKNITIVTCSEWLASIARQSYLLKNFNIVAIPNPIDISAFVPRGKNEIRKKLNLPENKKLILFGAANVLDKRKGIKYLIDALNILYEYPGANEHIEVVIFGKVKHPIEHLFKFKVHNLSFLNTQEQITNAYCLADIFVLPSLEDNLPNTVMEAMACGTPVVAFETGGLPEMIKHTENGYLAKLKSAKHLADGIHYVLFAQNYNEIAANARQFVTDNYSEEIIATKYNNLYKSLKSNKI